MPGGRPKNLGKWLKGERKKYGWSLRYVEDLTGVSNAHIAQIETGRIRRPDADLLVKLARVYELDGERVLYSAGYREVIPREED